VRLELGERQVAQALVGGELAQRLLIDPAAVMIRSFLRSVIVR
jgi:hypothetical protein